MDVDCVVSEVSSWTLAVACPSLPVVRVGTYSPQAWARDARPFSFCARFLFSSLGCSRHFGRLHCSPCPSQCCRMSTVLSAALARNPMDLFFVSAGTDGERGGWRTRFRRACLRSTSSFLPTSSFPQLLFRRHRSGLRSVVFVHTGFIAGCGPPRGFVSSSVSSFSGVSSVHRLSHTERRYFPWSVLSIFECEMLPGVE